LVPVKMRAVIEALQSLRGIAKISAVSINRKLPRCFPAGSERDRTSESTETQ